MKADSKGVFSCFPSIVVVSIWANSTCVNHARWNIFIKSHSGRWALLCTRACGNRNPSRLNRKRVTSQLSVSLDRKGCCANACVRVCLRLPVCWWCVCARPNRNSAPKEVRRLSVGASWLPARSQGREKLRIRFQRAATAAAAAWSRGKNYTRLFEIPDIHT